LDYLSKTGYWFDIKEFDMEWRYIIPRLSGSGFNVPG
jgi:hypothetical protein